MVLLKKKVNNEYFEFTQILRSGYHIREDNDRTTTKYVNGNRKQFLSEYEDVEIKIDLAPLDKETTKTYLDKLTSGEYMYYSLKHKEYRSVNMIISEIPEITVEDAINDNIGIADFSITLLKSSNVVVSI